MASSDEAIEAIYAASLDPAGWMNAAHEVGALFHTATGSFYVNRDGTDGLEVGVLASFGHADRAIADYLGYYGQINPFDVNLGRSAVGEVVTSRELDRRLRGNGIFANSEYFHDWVRPQHLRDVIGCYVDRSDGGTLCASFYRPSDAGAYSEGEIETFGRIMRHARRAVEIGVRLQTADMEMSVALARSGTAVFTLGRDGGVRHRNALAEALLASGCGFSETGRRLRTAFVEDQPALDRLITCAFDPRRQAWAENARLPVRRRDGGPPLIARIMANGQRFGAFAPDRVAAAVLTVEGFEAESATRLEKVRRRFGLTRAQATLALALGRGRSLGEAAAELGIGRETARSHLKAVFARTDTHRQAELVLLMRDLERS